MTVTLVKADSWQELHRIADRMMPGVRTAFLDALQSISDEISLSGLVDQLRSGDVEAALATIRTATTLPADTIAQIGDQLAAGTSEAATVAVRGLERNPDTGELLDPDGTFRRIDQQAVTWAQTHAAALVTNVTDETRRAVRNLIVAGLRGERSPYELARSIERIVGLTAAHAVAVDNYTQGLAAAGRSAPEIDRLAGRYAARLRRWRAETIARTETIRAAAHGRRQGWEAAANAGMFNRETARIVWTVTPDDRLCTVCAEQAGTTIGFDEQFTFTHRADDLAVANAGQLNERVTTVGRSLLSEPIVTEGPPAHPRCRCSIELELDA